MRAFPPVLATCTSGCPGLLSGRRQHPLVGLRTQRPCHWTPRTLLIWGSGMQVLSSLLHGTSVPDASPTTRRYEFRRSAAAVASRSARGVPSAEEVEAIKKERQFELEVDWIKALPGDGCDFLSISGCN